jgi:hypothetical protein
LEESVWIWRALMLSEFINTVTMKLIKMFVDSARLKAIREGLAKDSPEEKAFMRKDVDKRMKRVFE